MASVEQLDTQPAGLASLSKTLEMFDTYKSTQDEEKDSDEESFHLPMLGCDDDVDSNNKEAASETDKHPLQNGETEDEILNRFETIGTPDIDPKIEDSILDDIDDVCDKKESKNNEVEVKIDGQGTKNAAVEENCNVSSETDADEFMSNGFKVVDDIDADEDGILEENSAEEEKGKNKEEVGDSGVKDKETEIKDSAENDTSESVSSVSTTESNEDIIKNVNGTLESTKEPIVEDKESDESPKDEQKIIDDEDKNKEPSTNQETENTDTEIEKTAAVELEEETEDKENKLIEDMEVDTVETPIKEQKDVVEDKNDQIDMDTNNLVSNEKDVVASDKVIESECDKQGQNGEKDTSDEQGDELSCKPKDDQETELFKAPVIDLPLEKGKEKSVSMKEKMEPEKCENSNDSSKSQNLECDDLLDISIIRDVDEDNASAIEEHANEAASSDKSDNDDQEDGSDKAENELDSEMEQDETLLIANEKEDPMDFEDGNSSNMCDQDNLVSGSTSDSDVKEDSGKDSEAEPSAEPKENSALTDTTKDDAVLPTNREKTQTDEETAEKNKDDATLTTANGDSVNENAAVKLGKRSLSEGDGDQEVANKKIKLILPAKGTEKQTVTKNDKAKSLLTFQKYMQNKKLENNLSRSDLEQFCLQKICEAIIHKTDVGDLHQTIKKQEVIIENLRKDLQQLTKQTRDLDIVNKKLMNELKVQNGNKKPLVPLKITRSVGLQVKLNITTEPTIRRKPQAIPTPRTPNATNKTPQITRSIPTVNASVVRQVASSPSPRKTPVTTPLLSQALQSRQTPTGGTRQKQTPARPKLASENQQKAGNPGVIDLTDEDDKAAKTVKATPVKILNKTPAKAVNLMQTKSVGTKAANGTKATNTNQVKSPVVKNAAAGQVGQVQKANVGAKIGTPTRTVTTLPQGVRLTPAQVKNGSIAIPASVVTSSSGTTQLMYVVQSTSSLGQVVTSTSGGTQKAVLLNFQPTNGVLTSALNGSAVSVIPSKTANTVQLKTVAAPRKHPAPLPTPAPIPVNSALKPLLPKPHLSIRKTDTGIILQWRMPYNLDVYEGIASYQLFAYQETSAAPSTEMWRKVGDVKALALPMACTLTQFADKNKYYFAVRSVDVHKRIGAFSDPEEISL